MKPSDKPPACVGCPLHHVGVGFVPAEGPTSTAELLVVGQGPGDQEAYNSRPFYHMAPSGRTLNRWINQAGGQRSHIVVANVIQCWKPKGRKNGLPFGNQDPTWDEVTECYRRHLRPLIDSMPRLRWVVPVGAPAGRWFLQLPEGSYEQYVGTHNWREVPDVIDTGTRIGPETDEPFGSVGAGDLDAQRPGTAQPVCDSGIGSAD